MGAWLALFPLEVVHDQKKHLKQIFRVQDVPSHPVACTVPQLDVEDDDTVTISGLNNVIYPNTSKLSTTLFTMLVSVTLGNPTFASVSFSALVVFYISACTSA
jgi:hypothetical protein